MSQRLVIAAEEELHDIGDCTRADMTSMVNNDAAARIRGMERKRQQEDLFAIWFCKVAPATALAAAESQHSLS